MECMCYTHGSTSLFPGRSARVLRFQGTRGACCLTHESNNSLTVCSVVEEEMDEDVMDDKEEPSAESRPAKGGQSRVD